jgi:hypothetical protein
MGQEKKEKKLTLKNPYLLVAWPGMGEVAFKAAKNLIDKLAAQEFAEIKPERFFYHTASVIHEGILDLPQLPFSKLYYWKNKTGKNDLIIFLSNAQPDLAGAEEYFKQIMNSVKRFKIKMIVGFAAMPVPVDHTQTPKVWFCAASKELAESLKNFNMNLLSEGQISGMNGLFLGMARKAGYPGFCLLGEIPLYTIQIENPKAAKAVLESFARIMNIKLDLSGLDAQAHVLEEEINKLLDFLKIGPQSASPIGEEEIEKIKKSLSQLTKLPASVKEKIEHLFKAAATDISKAQDLKAELDRWSVYKEYEDRFLDLFKKSDNRNN